MKYNVSKLIKEVGNRSVGVYGPMYFYGTEMISDYYKRMNLRGKKVLTITASGDQVINAYFFGAKDVVGFDINKLAGFFIALKLTAIQALDYKEFLKFLGTGRISASLEYRLYLKIAERLDKKTKSFFDEIYRYFGFDGKKLAKSPLFNQRKYTRELLIRVNAYLKNKRSYCKIKGILSKKKIRFIQSNVMDIAGKIKGRFDVINLSNVPNFVTCAFRNRKDPAMYFYETVFLKLKKILAAKGRILFYTYSSGIYPNPFAPKVPPTSAPGQLKRFRARTEFKYREFRFKGLFGGYDKVVCLQNL